MIGYIEGKVIHREDTQLTLLCAGVGYEVNCTLNAMINMNGDTDSEGVWTHLIVREDAQLLYGFSDKTERSLFRELIRISGIGPKVAVAILSGMDSQGLVSSIRAEDSATLTKIPGIGKKTAERLVVEMKDRLASWGEADGRNMGAVVSDEPESKSLLKREAESALTALGYKATDASRMIEALELSDQDTVETLIRRALRNKLS